MKYLVLLSLCWSAMAATELHYTEAGIQYASYGPLKNRKPTLFVFALDIAKTFQDDAPYNALGRALSASGWNVVTFDVPCHGSDVRPGEPLELLAWTVRLNAGEDIVSAFDTKFRAVLDDLYLKGKCSAVATSGTSRGGYLACHAAICDPRVTHVVPLAPIVNLSRVLGGLQLPPALAHLESLYTYRENLAAKKVQIWIGPDDSAVSTQDSITLARCIGSINPMAVSTNIAFSINHQTPVLSATEAARWLINEMTPNASTSFNRALKRSRQ